MTLFNGEAPNLSVVDLSGIVINWNVTPFRNLTVLRFQSTWGASSPFLRHFMDILALSPRLEEFDILMENEYDNEDEELPPPYFKEEFPAYNVEMRSLQSFALGGWSTEAYNLISRLVLPIAVKINLYLYGNIDTVTNVYQLIPHSTDNLRAHLSDVAQLDVAAYDDIINFSCSNSLHEQPLVLQLSCPGTPSSRLIQKFIEKLMPENLRWLRVICTSCTGGLIKYRSWSAILLRLSSFTKIHIEGTKVVPLVTALRDAQDACPDLEDLRFLHCKINCNILEEFLIYRRNTGHPLSTISIIDGFDVERQEYVDDNTPRFRDFLVPRPQ